MSTEITINQDIVEVNVTEQVITIEAPSGAYPLPSLVNSVFGRVGNVVAQEGDYTLTQLGDVTLTSPSNGQVLKYNGTQWVNGTDTDTGLTSVGLSMPSAFSVANSPLTANGTLSVTGAGTTAQYVRGDGTLATFPVIAQEAQRLITEVYNSTGATLAKGSIVYINGGQGNLPTVTKAIATGDATSAQTYGVVQSDITNMNNGFVVAMGSLTNLDTQIYPVGTQLYLSATTAGAWTSTKPYAPQHLVYVGIVVRSHPTQGIVEIRIQNGYELDELHDVSAQSPTNGDILQYVAATDLWTKTAGTTTNIAEGTRLYFTDARARAAISLTTTGTSGASDYNNTTGVLNIPQYQGVLTNPVTGTGTTNTLPKFTGASTIGNSNISDSGTLITLGINTTISSGGLGIGSTNIGGGNGNINIAKTITGNAFSTAIWQNGTVQSDVTGSATSYQSDLKTVAASFILGAYYHYLANQVTIGAGSSVTQQNGFFVNSNMIGATNNYGFRGTIPVGAGRWNLFMDGMGANYLAGDTGIGTTSLGTATQLTIGGTETAVSAIGRGQLINTTLVASANSDVLVGLDIAPTFTNGAFTGTQNLAIRASSLIASNNGGFYGGFVANSNRLGNNTFSFSSHSPNSGVANQIYSGSRPATPNTNAVSHYVGTDTQVYWDTTNAPYNFLISGTQYLKLFNSTGNFTLQNGGTFTDAGFRLDVNGTTRFIGTATSDTAILGSELAAVTGTGTNWTLAGTNLNVGGYTHTTGSVVPLTTALAAVSGTYYQIAYTITGRTTGSITIDYGGTSTSGITATGATGPLASSTAVLTITPTTDFNGTVVLSIKTISASAASVTFANSALVVATEIRASDISSNLFFGRNNGRRNTTGINNTFVGSQAGINNTTGTSNTFVGIIAGRDNTIGSENTFIGTGSGQVNTIATSNTFLGSNTGANNNTGSFNTFIGGNSGLLNTSGNNNTFLGRAAGQNNTSGFGNVMIGNDSGRFITGGSTANTTSNQSVFIGQNTRAAADNQTNQIVIGYQTTGLGSNTTVIGNTSTTITGLYGNIRLVSGMGTAPASATATGTTGDIVVTAGFIYVCTATNTWVRTALTTF